MLLIYRESQFLRVDKLYKRRLAVPHTGEYGRERERGGGEVRGRRGQTSKLLLFHSDMYVSQGVIQLNNLISWNHTPKPLPINFMPHHHELRMP